MKKDKIHHNDFIIDRLTNSIVNTISGDSFPTEVSLLVKPHLKDITKKRGWLFDWKTELKSTDREVYKLTITNNLNVIQGLTSLTVKPDHVLIHLIENVLLIVARTNSMKVFQVTWLLSLADFHFLGVMTVLFHFTQRLI